MSHKSNVRVAQRIEGESASIDVLGPIMQFLTRPDEGMPCAIRVTIPPGIVIPLHSHPDPETFIVISGEVEGLSQTAEGFQWIRLAPGDVFHVPSGAKHALRNHWPEPAVMIAVTTARLGRFFLEVGSPVLPASQSANPSTPEKVHHFLEAAAHYGHWTATPGENYHVGIDLPPLWATERW